jgi:hypothetical protein
MTTLLLSGPDLPTGDALAVSARRRKWAVDVWNGQPAPTVRSRLALYTSVDAARRIVTDYGLTLIEPSLDLLATLPPSLLLRDVRCASFGELRSLSRPWFVKPADPLDKCFDAGVYGDVRDIRVRRPIADDIPVLVSEPVEWTHEYRCFVLDGEVVASSPYLSHGRVAWRPFDQMREPPPLPEEARRVCRHLVETAGGALPPTVVADVGVIEGCGWAVVEFNPVWCSGVLGADPSQVLRCLARACLRKRSDRGARVTTAS